jgi:hypothetical protein
MPNYEKSGNSLRVTDEKITDYSYSFIKSQVTYHSERFQYWNNLLTQADNLGAK